MLRKRARRVQIFLTDCDGCLTDGGMYYTEKGDELKKFNTKDGMAFKLLQSRGILTGIVTGENVELNRRRAEKMNMDIFLPGVDDKLSAILDVCRNRGITLDSVLYVGDDLNDLNVVKKVGISCCPFDATREIKKNVDYVSYKNGGNGLIREIFDALFS